VTLKLNLCRRSDAQPGVRADVPLAANLPLPERALECRRERVTKMRYLVVVEKGPSSFGAYVPDLPGCIAAGDTREEVLALIHEAIEFHLEGLKEDGQSIPPPSSSSELVDVAA